MNTKKIISSIVGSFGLGMVIQLISLLRTAQLANYFGTQNNMDAFNLANIISVCIINILGASIGVILIPFITDKKNYSLKTLNTYVTFLVLAIFILLCLSYASTYFYLFIYSSDSSEFNQLVYQLSLILGIGQFIRMFSSILTAEYQIEGKYILTKRIALIPSIIPFLLFIIFPTNNINVVAVTFTAAYFIEWVCLSYFNEKKYKYQISIDIRDQNFKKLLLLTWPVIVNSLIYQLVIIVPNTLSHSLGEGYVSAMSYANQILSTIQTLVIMNSINILYPIITKKIYECKDKGIEVALSYIKGINMIIIPIIFGIFSLGKPLISFLFERGNFDEKSTYLVYLILVLLCLQLPLIVFREILSKIFFSLEKTKMIVKVSVLSIVFEILFLSVFHDIFKLYIIALSPLVSQIIYITILIFYLIKNYQIKIVSLIKDHLLIIFNSIVMYFGIEQLKKIFELKSFSIITILILSILGLLIYAVMLMILQRKYCEKVIKELIN